MPDAGRGPFLVAVADRPAAIINSAEQERSARRFDLVEARVDLFAQQSLDGCAHDCARLQASGTPVILTIRSAAQGGRFDGPDAARLSAFSAAIASRWTNGSVRGISPAAIARSTACSTVGENVCAGRV